MAENYILGIELGSTRIKSVLIDEAARVIAQGSFEWENVLVDGLWSYSMDSVEKGLQASYAAMASDYQEKHGTVLSKIDAIGISAMMHGYLAFDGEDRLLVPFRTWRNTNAGEAAEELTELFGFHIPQRWSVSHYYQAIMNGEAHIPQVKHLNTLSGYVHFRLTGERVLGIGDASGMFPIDDGNYDGEMLTKFNTLLQSKGINTNFEELLPTVLRAGESAGRLTAEGAKFLDPTGTLQAGCVLCPPEGDVGTGMVATNSVKVRSANVSAGTSAFLMVALERRMEKYYKEIDVVASPSGTPVAMIHSNNFTSEITAWANLFEEVIALGGGEISRAALFDALFKKSLEGDAECGGMVGYNFIAAEPIIGAKKGTTMVARAPGGALTLGNFMKMQIYSALGALAAGCEILKREKIEISSVCGHGGFFKTPMVGQKAMSAAIGAPVTVMKNAGEGGAWGVAVLALFATVRGLSLDTFLDTIFADSERLTVSADEREVAEFSAFIERYKRALPVQELASEVVECWNH